MAEGGCVPNLAVNHLEVVGNVQFGSNNDLTLTSGSASKPEFVLENTANDATASTLKFNKARQNPICVPR